MDNPRKKKADGKRVSQQKHEQAYQRSKSKRNSDSPGEKRTGSGEEPKGENRRRS